MQSVPPILDGELLRAFVAFADTRNFTHAARAVGLSQPALFERVKRLSELLGIQLYERDGASIALTERGQRFAPHGREALARDEAFVRELRGEAAPETVTLAAGEGALLYLLGPALARFAETDASSLRLLTLGTQAACEA